MSIYTELFITTLVVTAVFGYDVQSAKNSKMEVRADEPVASPVTALSASPTPIAVPDDIVGYINYKFGSDAPKAFLLLQGNGAGSCAENRHLNPKAVNNNTEWGGIGRDRGYWQINDVFHPSVSDWCASDVKCSTDYAYRMWTNDGKSFKRWTCGREYSI